MSEEEHIEQSADNNPQPSNGMNENSSQPNIEQAQTTNHQLQTKEMEVHHPHHPTHKKKWGEYLLEFLMLFLAVFLGFIAENIRENYVDRQKEKEYMHGMITDLQKDTATLRKTKYFATKVLQATDSTLIIFDNPILTDSLIKLLYKYNKLVYRIALMELEDRTATQLKNAGGLRLIRNQKVLDTLSNYWEIQKKSIGIGQNLQDKKDKAHELEFRIFFDRKYYKDNDKPFEWEVVGNPVLSSNAPALLPEYTNRLNSIKGITKNYIVFITELQSLANRTIKTIQQEYRFENE